MTGIQSVAAQVFGIALPSGVAMDAGRTALAVSAVAFVISVLAFRNARIARLQALRSEARRALDGALASARLLIERAEMLAEDTMRTASELQAAGTPGFRPDEREALDLRREAERPLEDLERLDAALSRTSRRRLEASLEEIARVRRSMDDLGMRVDLKTAALDRLLSRAPVTGREGGRTLAFRSASHGGGTGDKEA